jgi:hypothetical protein
MSSPKRYFSLPRKKTDRYVGKLYLDFCVCAIKVVLLG